MNILYVEDNTTDADLLIETLSRTAPHVEVDWVRTCGAALEKLKACAAGVQTYDLMLTDMELSDGDGGSPVSFVQQNNLPVAVVIITGMGTEETAVAALKAGISDYVAKQEGYVTRIPDILHKAVERFQSQTNRHSGSFRVLYVEHDATDVDLTVSHFSRYAPHIHLEIVRSADEILAIMPVSPIDGNGFKDICDVLLIDYHLPSTNAVRLLRELLEIRGLDLPVVVLAENGDKDSVTQAFGMGAMDYVVKHPAYLHQLVGVLENAFHRRQLVREKQALRASEEYFRSLIENATDIIVVVGASGLISYASPSYERILGFSAEEIVHTRVDSIVHPDDLKSVLDIFKKLISDPGITGPTIEIRISHRDGSYKYMESVGKGIQGTSAKPSVVFNMRDITQRKETEKTLFESEERYRTAIEHSYDGVALVRGNTHIYVNQRFLDMFGYTRQEEITGTDTYITVHPEDRAAVIEYNQRRQQGDPIPTRYMFKGIKKDGSILYVDVSATTVHLKNEPVTFAFLRDITDRVLTQQKIVESEHALQAILRASPIGIGRTKNGVIDWVNDSMSELSGYSGEDLKGKSISIFYDNGSEHDITGETLRLHSQLVTKLRKKNGELKHVLIQSAPIDISSYIFTVTDVTQQKEAEEALLESEAKYKIVVENSLAGFYIIQDNLFRFVNKRWCEMYGYTYDEIVDRKSPFDVAAPEERALVEENIRKRISGEVDHIEYEFRSLRKDGKVMNVRVLGAATTFNGKPAVTGTVVDSSREKMLESQLRQAQKMEAIGTLAGGVAHDFNNILTALIGYGTLLQLKLGKESPLQRYTEQILSASQKGAGLTKSLLAFSRKQPLSLSPINLNDIVAGTEKLLKRLVREDIILKTILFPEDVGIMADTTQIDQILFNLVTNARDAMPSGGVLTIQTRVQTIDASFVSTYGFGTPGSYAVLTISDTGTGMDSSVLEHIFDPFFTTKEVGKGTGLGLSTVYGVVQQHNGHISIDSKPNAGTGVHIYFPLISSVIEKTAVHDEHVRGGEEKVLIAEDNREVRILIRNVLSEFGYTIIEAGNGEEAIRKFREHDDIDLLILDSVMPKMNGREVFDSIRTDNQTVRVLFISGYTRDVVLDKGIEDKEFAFIAKPLSPTDLLRKVREVLDSSKRQ